MEKNRNKYCSDTEDLFTKVLFPSEQHRTTARNAFLSSSAIPEPNLKLDPVPVTCVSTAPRLPATGDEAAKPRTGKRKTEVDWQELSRKWIGMNSLPANPRLLTMEEINRQGQCVNKNHSRPPGPSVATKTGKRRAHKTGNLTASKILPSAIAKRRRSTRRSLRSMPRGIQDVSAEDLRTASLHRQWRTLDFCGAASMCGNFRSLIPNGRSLRMKDVECHVVTTQASFFHVGYYATAYGRDFSSNQYDADISAVGKSCLGWHADANGVFRLLFQTKQSAKDHFLLLMTLLGEHGSNWRLKMSKRLFGKDSSARVVPVTKTDTKSSDTENPYFYLVKSNSSTPKENSIYAVFVYRKELDQQYQLEWFPFSF